MDEIVTALGGASDPVPREARREVLQKLSAGEIDFQEAMAQLKGSS
jgi:hypothetical protein